MRRRPVLAVLLLIRGRDHRLLQLPRPVLGTRRRRRRGRFARAAGDAAVRHGHDGDQGPGAAGDPGDGGLHHRHVGGLRALLPGRGPRQAAGGLGQRCRGRLARARRAQGHALSRHADVPPRRHVGHRRGQSLPSARRAPAAAHPVQRPQRAAAAEGSHAQEGRSHAGPASGRVPASASWRPSSPRIPAARPTAAISRRARADDSSPRSTAPGGRCSRARPAASSRPSSATT